MTDRVDQLVAHVHSITANLAWHGRAVFGVAPPPTDKLDLARRCVHEDLTEIRTLLVMLIEAIHDLRANRMTDEPSEGCRRLERGTEEWKRANRSFLATDKAIVTFKALYEWLYHLREDLRAHDALKQSIGTLAYSSLTRCCGFRNALVTHRSRRRVYTQGGTRFSADFVDIDLILMPIGGLPDSVTAELDSVFQLAAVHLPADSAQERNQIERMALLYRNLDFFPENLRARVNKLMLSCGAVSDTPLAIGGLAAALAADVYASLPKPNQQPHD